PKKSSASACSDADPAAKPTPISTRNMVRLIARTAQRTRRYAAFPRWGSGAWQSWQQVSKEPLLGRARSDIRSEPPVTQLHAFSGARWLVRITLLTKHRGLIRQICWSEGDTSGVRSAAAFTAA